MDQTPPTPQPQQQSASASPKRGGHRILITLVLLVVLGACGFFAYSYLQNSAPVGNAETELIQPEINDLADVQAYLGDKPVPPRVDAAVLPPIEDDEHLWGQPTSPVSIVLYGNLTGNFSRLYLPGLRSIVDDSNGNVNLIFRNYPLTENPLDYDAAELGECTYVQTGDAGYWSYVDALLARYPSSNQDLLAAVASAGADPILAQDCLDGEDTWDYVVAQKQEVQLAAKIFVAPSVIVVNNETGDTRIVEGINTRAFVESVIAAVR